MALGEDVVLHGELVGVLEVAQLALLRRLGKVRVGTHRLGHGQLGLLLLGASVLEPDLHDPLGQSDLFAQQLAFRHGGRLVVHEEELHHLHLQAGHLRAVPLLHVRLGHGVGGGGLGRRGAAAHVSLVLAVVELRVGLRVRVLVAVVALAVKLAVGFLDEAGRRRLRPVVVVVVVAAAAAAEVQAAVEAEVETAVQIAECCGLVALAARLLRAAVGVGLVRAGLHRQAEVQGRFVVGGGGGWRGRGSLLCRFAVAGGGGGDGLRGAAGLGGGREGVAAQLRDVLLVGILVEMLHGHLDGVRGHGGRVAEGEVGGGHEREVGLHTAGAEQLAEVGGYGAGLVAAGGGGQAVRGLWRLHGRVRDGVHVDLPLGHFLRVLGGQVRLQSGLGAEERSAEGTTLVDELLVRAVLALALPGPRVLEPHLHHPLLETHLLGDGLQLLAAGVAVQLVLLVQVVQLLRQDGGPQALVARLVVAPLLLQRFQLALVGVGGVGGHGGGSDGGGGGQRRRGHQSLAVLLLGQRLQHAEGGGGGEGREEAWGAGVVDLLVVLPLVDAVEGGVALVAAEGVAEGGRGGALFVRAHGQVEGVVGQARVVQRRAAGQAIVVGGGRQRLVVVVLRQTRPFLVFDQLVVLLEHGTAFLAQVVEAGRSLERGPAALLRLRSRLVLVDLSGFLARVLEPDHDDPGAEVQNLGKVVQLVVLGVGVLLKVLL